MYAPQGSEAEPTKLRQQVEAIRHFNRFYTRAIGTLQAHLLGSSFTLAEARVLYELSRDEHLTARKIAAALDLDAGYLSRILATFARKRLIVRQQCSADARQALIRLTKLGKKEFSSLNHKAAVEIGSVLEPLGREDREKIVSAMKTIEQLLSSKADNSVDVPPFILRPHRPGDLGWVVQRHGVLYAREYGWDERFEALVARLVADFVDHFDGRRERCWIAERNEEPVGCIFLVKHPELPESVAKLRMLLVEPAARGFGIGRRLVKECTLFARAVGYRKIELWTNSVLDAARRLYQGEGYKLVEEKPHHSFGKDLVGQTWELAL
jgi:DNA-binding MarR family transcriptional regulator/GNAT superfamily N-acetyltransferase